MSGFTTWKIEPNGSGWIVRRHDTDEHESHHDEKEVAIRMAVELATEDPPSQVLVHSDDGSVTGAVHYNDTGDGDARTPEDSRLHSGKLLATYSEDGVAGAGDPKGAPRA